MRIALEEAAKAAERGEIPVGAVLVDSAGRILARDGNRSIELRDPAGHAEMLVMRSGGRLAGNYRLTDASLYVTLEPCIMCAGAMIHARIGRLVYGAADPKAGAIVSLYEIAGDSRLNHTIDVSGGLLAEEGSRVLRDFFKARRGQAAG